MCGFSHTRSFSPGSLKKRSFLACQKSLNFCALAESQKVGAKKGVCRKDLIPRQVLSLVSVQGFIGQISNLSVVGYKYLKTI